jgi:hypothetical protein
MFADQIGEPSVRNRLGTTISNEISGIRAVLEKKCLSGTLEDKAKTIGIAHIMIRIDRSKMKREATIIAIMAISLAKGFIACNTPFLLLISSMYTNVSAPSTKSLRDCGTFIMI